MTQVVLQLLLAHADAVVADRQGAGFRVGVEGDAEVFPLRLLALFQLEC